MLQRVVELCSVLQCFAEYVLYQQTCTDSGVRVGTVCCIALQRIATCCSVLQNMFCTSRLVQIWGGFG